MQIWDWNEKLNTTRKVDDERKFYRTEVAEEDEVSAKQAPEIDNLH